MIPIIFCGKTYRDWPWWMFWKVGHREHEHQAELMGPTGPFMTLAMCPGYLDWTGEG